MKMYMMNQDSASAPAKLALTQSEERGTAPVHWLKAVLADLRV
jgi:hypothetical protein